MTNKNFQFSSNAMPDKFTLLLGSCLGLGFIPFMPGTLASAFSTLLFPVTFREIKLEYFALTLIALITLSVRISSRCEVLLGENDPGAVTIDEFVAVPLVLWPAERLLERLAHPYWLFLLLGFCFFRIFDIIKPLGIKELQNIKGGPGIVLDDLAAAIPACICLVLTMRLISHLTNLIA